MSRRVVLIIALVALALLATAVAPWTLSRDGVVASVTQQLLKGYGASLEVRGRSTLAILPVPRVKFDDVTLVAADRSVTAQGGTLRGELRLLPLLLGRVELAEVGLSHSKIAIDGQFSRFLDWAQAFAVLKEKATKGSLVRRLVVTASSVRWSEDWDGSFDDVGLVFSWPDTSESLEVAGWTVWRGERVEISQAAISPAVLATGQPSPFTLTLAAPMGRVTAKGEALLGSDPRITGETSIEARSVRDFSRWSGLDLPLGSLVRGLSVSGEFLADRRRVTWPSVAVTLGSDTLDGTLAVRFDSERPLVTGTLAAGRLDLTDFVVPFMQARTPSGLWSGDELAAGRAGMGGDLDLRLSATDGRIGRVKLKDMATSVLVRPGRIEVSLGRADLHEGTVKGRLTLATANKVTDLKLQGTFDNIDLGPTLIDLGNPRWITGTAQGSFAIEGSGRTAVELVRQTHGRASIMVKKGELVGIGLETALRRVEKQPLSGSLEWKGGRTPFDRAAATVTVGSGIGEVSDGILSTPAMRTALTGRVSLVDRSLNMRAEVSPTPAGAPTSPLIQFDVTGGWDDVAIVPDAKSLIERSGAAKPLFGFDRSAPGTQGASALPQ
jgi:AsmA protein